MAVITVTDEWTAFTTGSEMTDSLLIVGKDMKTAIGSTAARTYDNATPMTWGQPVVIPAGVQMSGICGTGNSFPAWLETGFS